MDYGWKLPKKKEKKVMLDKKKWTKLPKVKKK
jgi:hypothetical protein